MTLRSAVCGTRRTLCPQVPMTAEIRKFRRKRQNIEADQARLQDATQLLLGLPDLSQDERETVTRIEGRCRGTLEAEQGRWWFTMLSPTETREAVALIHQHIERRDAATRLFLVLMTHIEMHTGRVIADRAQLAADAFMPVAEVSRALTSMARLGLVQKRGIGLRASWFVNPRVAWRGSEEKRKSAVKNAVQLRLIPNNPI